jgi:hypothetical protein
MWNGFMRTLTVLPQVTAPWRFSIGAGAARVDAARARTAKIEVYMLLVVIYSEGSWKSELKRKTSLAGNGI